MRDRLTFIDTVKGIGIYFVILGHCPGLSSFAEIYIYSFHMPLFFFIVGMFFKPSNLEFGIWRYVIQKARERLIPYFFFGTFFYLIWLARYYYGSSPDITPLKPLIGMFYGISANGYMPHNYVLWFLPCLFTTEILFFSIKKFNADNLILLIIIVVCSIIGYFNSFSVFPRLPFGIDVSLISIAFYYAGFIMKDKIIKEHYNKWIMIISFSLGILFSYLNGRVDMNNNYYGNYFYFIAASFLNILFWIEFSKMIPQVKLLRYVGRNSLLFFMFQELALMFLYRIYLFQHSTNKPDTLYAIFWGFSGLIMLIPVSALINKYVPSVLLGKVSVKH